MKQRIRKIIVQSARLPIEVTTLADDEDLYRAGLTSHASVNLMLALEDEFDVEFPERMLKRQTFESVTAIAESIETLLGETG